MNKPYVKQYDENGLLLNPIEGKYTHSGPNRKMRNAKPPRYFNNSANCQMSIVKNEAYRKYIQWVDRKPIVHYVLKTR